MGNDRDFTERNYPDIFESYIWAQTAHSCFWNKEDEFFSEKDGFPSAPFPNSWQGKNGLYAMGFTKRGLLGASQDAVRIAEDIASQWNSKTKHLPLEL